MPAIMHIRVLAVLTAALFVVCVEAASSAPAQLTVHVPADALKPQITVEIRSKLDKEQPVRRLFFDGRTVRGENVPRLRWKRDATAFIAENIALPPTMYHLAAIDESSHETLKEITLAAESDGRYHFDVTRPTLLNTVATAVGNLASIPMALITLLAATLAGVLRDKLKKLWEITLDGVGRLGIRRLRERSFTRAYLRNLVYNHTYLKLIGLNTAGFSRPQLERVFISLRIASYDQRPDAIADRSSVPFDSAAGRFPRLVILGAPGAGKTTTLSYALLQFAHGRGLARFGVAEPLLPIFIPLRRVSAENRGLVDDLVDPSTQILPEEVLARCPAGYFERKLKAGRCILLLDGLDEVASESQHRLVAQKINNVLATWPRNRVIVTCRTAGWQDLLPDFQVLQTEDFDRAEIHSFIEGWHAAVITEMERSRVRLNEPEEARFEEAWRKEKERVATAIDVQSRKLIAAIEGNQRIQAVATNPMLLSLICLVHLSRHILPRGRALLYRECIEMLTDAWDRERDLMSTTELTYTQKEAALRQIALAFQQSGKGELPSAKLETVAEQVARSLGASVTGTEFVRLLERRSGLLVERSIDIIGFSHLTLQEYLVARHIQQNPNLFHLIEENVDNPAWREVMLLYCGLVDDATTVVELVLAVQSTERTLLAAHCIGESQTCDPEIVKRVIGAALALLVAPRESITHVDIETLTTALAAVAADYKDAPVTHEQHLSEWLIQHPSIITLDSLGRARVTKALPLLVQTLQSADGLEAGTAMRALTMFGDLALPEMQRSIEIGDLGLFAKRFVLTLGAINTGPAARLLVRQYRFGANSLNFYVSLTLAEMFRSDRIVDDLLDLPPMEERPLGYPRGQPSERAGWKYWRRGTLGFRQLEAILRFYVLLRPELKPEQQLRPSGRLQLPALLEELSELAGDKRMAAAAAGFPDSPRLQQLIDEVTAASRRGDVDLWTTLERANTAREKKAEQPSARRWILAAFAVMVYWHIAMFGMPITALAFATAPESTFYGYWFLAGYVLLTGLAVRWRWRTLFSLDFVAAYVCPYPAILRRLPRLSVGRPWIAFALFSCVVLVCIAPVFIMMRGLLAATFGWVLVFIAAMAVYYALRVLPSDPLRELIEFHPEGRELLRRG
jgi:hypothetical protein